MAEKSKTDYLFAPAYISAAVGMWAGEKAVALARRSRRLLPFGGSSLAAGGMPGKTLPATRIEASLASDLRDRVHDQEASERLAQQLCWHGMRVVREDSGETGGTFSSIERTAEILREHKVPESVVDELLRSDAVQEIVRQPH